MLRRTVSGLIGVSALMSLAMLSQAAEPAAAQPVFILLYSRFYDHSHPFFNDERVRRLIPLIEKLRARYPDSGISGLFEFSGSMSQVVLEENFARHGVDAL